MPADFKTNREMNEPFPTPDSCNDAIKGFTKELGEADEGEWIISALWGNGNKMPSLTAWAYGSEQAEYREALNTMVANAGRKQKVK